MNTKNLKFSVLLGLIIPVQSALAEFKKIEETKKGTHQPTAEFFNNFLYYINISIALIFILFLLILLASGIEFLTAGGDEGSLEKAHRLWQVGLLGLVSALIAYITVNLIKYFI
jgi:hypothetical protein